MTLLQNEIELKVGSFIADNAGLDELDYDLEIFEEGVVNSLFAIELMTYIEKAFSIKIRIEDLDMKNFKSVNVITRFIQVKMEGTLNG